MNYRADKGLSVDVTTLFGRALPPCLPAGRYPGLDARGRGTWDVHAAVRWDPYRGYAPSVRNATEMRR